MLAKTFRGLEDVLRDELIALGAENVEVGNRVVSFEGTLETMYRANLSCRTALRILKPIEKFTAANPDELYDIVRDMDWSRYMDVDSTFSIDCTANGPSFTHSRYVVYRVKDGIVDYFNDRLGKRPSIRLQGADLELDVHIDDDRVTISLNSSGEPLSKRGYRVEATDAPLNEVLAAGIIMKTGWRGDSLFLDPMCGSGTFAIEAALIAARINPGIFRSGFAFEKWSDFDKELFERLYNDDSDERTPPYRIIATDIDPEAVKIATANVKSARLEEMITLGVKDFFNYEEAPDGEPGIIVTNPPYGERLMPEEDIDLFYTRVGSTLKTVFKGYHAWILGYRDEAFAHIGLKPSVKFPINNGGLECSLREYVMFDGSYSAFRTEGGSVRNETFNRTSRPKVRRMTDKEWDSESRKYSRGDDNRRTSRKSDGRFGKDGGRRGKKDNDRRRDNGGYEREREFRPDFKRDREYNDFRRDRDSRDDFRRDRQEGPSRGLRKSKDVKFQSAKRPSIGREYETKFGPARMRSRKGNRNGVAPEEEND